MVGLPQFAHSGFLVIVKCPHRVRSDGQDAGPKHQVVPLLSWERNYVWLGKERRFEVDPQDHD
jgi:hypothetical protein